MGFTLSPDGYDPEFVPLQEGSRAMSKQLWSLPWDDFIKAWATAPPALPPGAPQIEEIEVSHEMAPTRDGAEIDLQIYRPKGVSGKLALFLVMHAGGWVVGSHTAEEGLTRYTCVKNKCLVISVDYRMAPKHKFPTAINDCYDALQWLRGNAARFSFDPERIIVGGDSAGGNLSAALTLKLRDENLLKGVIGQVLNVPATCHPDLGEQASKRFNIPMSSMEDEKDGYVANKENMYWFWNHYTTNPEPHPYASPLLAESHADLPPAIIQVAARDTLRCDGFAYAKALHEAGVPVKLRFYPGLPHAFFMFSTLSQTLEYHEAVVEWVGELLGQRA